MRRCTCGSPVFAGVCLYSAAVLAPIAILIVWALSIGGLR